MEPVLFASKSQSCSLSGGSDAEYRLWPPRSVLDPIQGDSYPVLLDLLVYLHYLAGTHGNLELEDERLTDQLGTHLTLGNF